MLRKEIVIIFGSSGQLGKEISSNIDLNSNFQVFPFDKKGCDIGDFEEVSLKINEIKPTYIINCAAYTNVDKAETERDKAELINFRAVANISQICKEMNITLIHFSTDYVFNANSKKSLKEESQKNPINYYGLTKHLGEEEIFKNCRKFFLFRISWVYSLHGENFPKKIIGSLNDGKNLRVVDDQFGSPTPTLLGSSVVGKILCDKELNKEYGVYHISPNNKCSWFDIAKRIAKKLNHIECKIEPTTSKNYKSVAMRPTNSHLNNALFKKTFKMKIYNWDYYMDNFLEAFDGK